MCLSPVRLLVFALDTFKTSDFPTFQHRNLENLNSEKNETLQYCSTLLGLCFEIFFVSVRFPGRLLESFESRPISEKVFKWKAAKDQVEIIFKT